MAKFSSKTNDILTMIFKEQTPEISPEISPETSSEISTTPSYGWAIGWDVDHATAWIYDPKEEPKAKSNPDILLCSSIPRVVNGFREITGIDSVESFQATVMNKIQKHGGSFELHRLTNMHILGPSMTEEKNIKKCAGVILPHYPPVDMKGLDMSVYQAVAVNAIINALAQTCPAPPLKKSRIDDLIYIRRPKIGIPF